MITNENGEFTLDNVGPEDSIVVSYVGFKTVTAKGSNLRSPVTIYLREYVVELNEVSVSSKKLHPNDLLEPMRAIRGNLYASNTEVTNFEYNRFLYFSGSGGDNFAFDLSNYRDADKAYFRRYQADRKGSERKRHDSTANYSSYPAVNISYEGAVAYCAWLTDEYNNSPQRKRYKKVKFRLPTLDEWRIAAGDPEFQSWKPEENYVMIAVPVDTVKEVVDRKKKKKKFWVKDEVWYPWWGAYHYRKKAQNHLNFFLGNFKEPLKYQPCIPPKGAPAKFKCPPYGDGWSRMAQTASYFPNNIGLYDVVGNVAEMIDEKGKACGGSWNDFPPDATLWSVNDYTKPSGMVGFRVFMEIMEK